MRFEIVLNLLLISLQIVHSERNRSSREQVFARIKKSAVRFGEEKSKLRYERNAASSDETLCNLHSSNKSLSELRETDDHIANSTNNDDTLLSTPTTKKPLRRVDNEVRYYCEPEEFRHDYFTADETTRQMTNSWQRARIGEHATTRELCLLPNGLPLTRACLFNSARDSAEWENSTQTQNISCLRWTRKRIGTFDLNRLLEDVQHSAVKHRAATNRNQLQKAAMILQKLAMILLSSEMLPADVHYLARILSATVKGLRDPQLSRQVVGLCSHLMAQDPEMLRLSGEINATNSLLDTFEEYMDDQIRSDGRDTSPSCLPEINFDDIPTNFPIPIDLVTYPSQGVRAYLSENVSVFFANPECAGITGIAVYEPTTNASNLPMHREERGDFLYRFIRSNESSSEILTEPGLLVASFIPVTLWTALRQELLARDLKPQIVLKIYATDCLFVEKGEYLKRKPRSKVLSISIPGHSGPFKEYLPFLLRNEDFDSERQFQPGDTNGTGCGYWNYTTWLSAGIQSPSNSHRLPVILCGSLHVTQFSFLVGGSYRQSNPNTEVLITPLQQRALDIISLLGCALSLVGLIGIWLTGAFRTWRALAPNKILLNICFVLTLQLVLFLFVNTQDMTEDLLERNDIVGCVALGALLQYTVLVVFCWMLIAAFLQFQRYVTVIGIVRPKHYILKLFFAAWGLPLIPTLLTVLVDTQSYVPTEFQIQQSDAVCYPSGHALTFGVVLPITLITIVNLYIFACVFYSIARSLKHVEKHNERRMIKKQVRLSVLLFFLFGLSWFFGLFAYMQIGIVFSYLFCLTATLQGFVLFIFFVILDATAHRLWHNFFCGETSTKTKRATELRSTELQSMTTTPQKQEQNFKVLT